MSNTQPPYGNPPPYGYYQPAPPRKSWPRRHKILTGLGSLVAFFILIGVIAAIAGGKGAGTSGGTTSGTSSSSGSSTTSGSSSPQASVGTPVRDGKFQFTITKVTHAKSVGNAAAGLGDTAQGRYTILHVTVTNIGSQAQTLDDSAQFVYDASGRKYDASSNADFDLNSSGAVFLNDINPGNTVRGLIAFDMPAGVRAVKAELHDSVFSGGVTVNLR